ncbi:hypothetical protein IQ249_25370 [Lusitaniella coriacea LEGE 07157]|uniref:Uncharacterized protein n=1 Tax=Lusitaniella coriacea LEGE 07157 TaxID=945747 RepID=A0A8J7E0K8_9CYAN|nr:hypothetical protein [Lusitaniella coriacea]MBE9119184.1 hypothetical protein [Lusitaniella coriacea LEGE 07157]
MTNCPLSPPHPSTLHAKLEVLRSIDSAISHLLTYRDKSLLDIAEFLDIAIYDRDLNLLHDWQELVEGAIQLIEYKPTNEVTKS